tara:strand:- start:166 stop:462 length:297 start_codon:yes stop_codon:yes gene_type:complete
MSLILSRNIGEVVCIGDTITVQVADLDALQVVTPDGWYTAKMDGDEVLQVTPEITVTIVRHNGNRQIALCVVAPRYIPVDRYEVRQRIINGVPRKKKS